MKYAKAVQKCSEVQSEIRFEYEMQYVPKVTFTYKFSHIYKFHLMFHKPQLIISDILCILKLTDVSVDVNNFNRMTKNYI